MPTLADGARATEPVLSRVATKDVPSSPGADAAAKGAWSPARAWPVIAIHAALLADGRVMTYGTDRNGKQGASLLYDVWDPAAARIDQGHLTLDNATGTDLFCSAQTLLPLTGQLFIAGGDIVVNGSTTNTANRNTTLFDPTANTLTRGVDMNRPRWYSSVTTLASGATYVQGGLSGTDFPELRLSSGGLQLLGTAPTGGLDYWYPRNFVAPDGRVFGFDIQGRMYAVDTQGTGSIERFDNLVMDLMGSGSTAVLYAPGRVLQIGGNTPRSAVVDFTGPLPVVTETSPLAGKRFWATGTVLPDGRVLATGGSAVENALTGVDNTAALWDPVTGRWTVGASASFARLYHSTALLLPDATVLVAGGGAPGPLINTNAEIYYPPYLFNAAGQLAARPQLASVPATLTPGEHFAVDLAVGSLADRLVLIRAGSVTHSVNFDQRRIELPVQRVGTRLNTELPRNPATVPPGFYLMFAIDTAGVPSVAKIVRVAPGQAADIDADWTGRLGGHGAAPFSLECPIGEAAVGVRGSVGGGGIASIGPRCVTLRADGHWVGTPVDRGLAGVAGTTAFTRTCATDSALVGLRGTADASLSSLVLSCRKLKTAGRVEDARVELAAVGSAVGTARPYRACGFDHPAHALYGTAGASVESLGLLCRGDPEGSGSNQPPVATSPGFQTGKVGTAVSLQIVATDPDLDALAFSAANLPAGLQINPQSGRITGVPTTIGARSVTVTVGDGASSTIIGFDWEIFPAGDNAPVLRAPGDQQSFVGSAVSLALQSFDPDGQPLAFSAIGLPTGLVLNPSTGLIGGTPSSIGSFAVTVSASDGTRTTQANFTWQIVSQTPPPETCNRLSNGDFELGTSGWELEADVAIVSGGRNASSAARVGNGWIGSRASVFADDTYEVSFFHRSTGSGWAGMGLDFFDAAGTNIGSKTATLPMAAAFEEYRMVVSPPAGTAVMRFWVYAAESRVLTIDDVDLRRVGCGGPPPAPDACNRIGNPGFEAGTTGWELHAVTALVGSARAGAAALSMTDGWIGSQVPAAAGQRITASGWFKVGAQGGWAGLGIDFLDAAGNELADFSGTLSETDTFSPYQLTATAPAGTVAARLWVWASPGLEVVVDEAGMKLAGCGEAVTDPCNRLPNPGFERGLTDWEREAEAAIVPGARSGVNAVTVRNGWIGSRIVGVANRSYTGRVQYQRSAAGGYAVMGIDYFDADGTDLGESVQVLGASSGWTSASVTGTSPAGTAFIRLWVYVDGDLTLTIDDADLRETNCSVPPPPEPCNAIANPGFEQGFEGWQRDAYARTIVDSRTGSKAAEFRGGWIGATGPVQAGAAYVASAYVKIVGASGWAAIGVKWFDAAGAELRDDVASLDNRTQYGEAVLAVTAPAGATRARLWLYAVGGRVMTVDDVGLRRVGCAGG
ncbi:MAG: galactose oxidase-like domain-containing protein [Lautropia sp.]